MGEGADALGSRSIVGSCHCVTSYCYDRTPHLSLDDLDVNAEHNPDLVELISQVAVSSDSLEVQLLGLVGSPACITQHLALTPGPQAAHS